MEKLVRTKPILGMALILSILSFGGVISAQESPKDQPAGKQGDISDRELKAFVKAYVEYQKIRREYEPAMNGTQDPKEKQRLEIEGNAKLKKVLDREGLSPDAYNRIFARVNSDKQLRDKVLKMVAEERKKS